jgi:hypothetical protein
MKNLIILLILTSIFFSSCVKETEPTRITGNVEDFYSNEKISGINLRIIEIPKYGSLYSEVGYFNYGFDSLAFADSIRVKANGSFDKLIYDLDKNNEYQVFYYDDSKVISNFPVVVVDVGVTNQMELKTKDYKILEIKINTETAEVDSLYTFILSESSQYFNKLYSIINPPQELFSSEHDTILYFKVVPETNIKIMYGNYIEIYDSVAYDTTIQMSDTLRYYFENIDTNRVVLDL